MQYKITEADIRRHRDKMAYDRKRALLKAQGKSSIPKSATIPIIKCQSCNLKEATGFFNCIAICTPCYENKKIEDRVLRREKNREYAERIRKKGMCSCNHKYKEHMHGERHTAVKGNCKLCSCPKFQKKRIIRKVRKLWEA